MTTQALSAERAAALVHDATAAPSMHNAQPWRFRCRLGEGVVDLRADFSRVMPHADPDARGLHIGCGAALLNLRVAVVHRGLRPVPRLLPDAADPALLATVLLDEPGPGSAPGAEERELGTLYPAIHRRHTSRQPFAETEIPSSLRSALADAARAEGAFLDFPSHWHLRWVLELAEEAETRNRTDRGEDEDLADWTRVGGAAPDTAGDGVPAYAFGPRRRGGRAPVRDFAGARSVPGRDAAEFEERPQLALISTREDRPEDWLRAGQAMQHVLLLATREGLAGSPATQAVEWADLRWPLRDPMSATGRVQMVLRLGYGPQGPATPRRPPHEILDIEP